MIFKSTPKKQISLILLILFSVVTSTAQANLPYFTNFESNNGGWTDGVNRSRYIANFKLYAPQGRGSWVLYDNNGNASSFYKNFNLSGLETVIISFSFKSNAFDNDNDNDSFEVKLGGTTILTYKHDEDWNNNNQKYTATITLSSSSYTFTNNSEIRFECDAGREDYVYFDEISITGTSPSPPVADFSADNITPYTDDVVTFTDASTNTPTGWAWSFSPNTISYVNGTSASSQNPEVTFSASGLYKATLTATNNGGNDAETKTSYISVVEPASDNPASFTVSQSTVAPYTFFDYSSTANASNDPILVAYNTTNSFGTPATDGNGNAIINGAGTIVFEGAVADINTTINSNPLNQLDQNSTYYFKAWSIGTAGFSRGVEANATTAAVETPISFVATASTFNNNIVFRAQANSLNDNLMLVFNTEDDFGIPEDGVLYQIDDNIGNATVLLSSVNAETINNYVDDLLILDTRYYYRIYSVSSGIWYYSQYYGEDDDTTIDGFIWQNEIDGDDPNRDNPYTDGDEVSQYITVSGISRGNGITGKDNDNDYEATNWSISSSLNIADNDYFEFTLTPDSGYEINFLEFFYDANEDQGSLDNVAVRSSIDGYASNIGSLFDGGDGAEFDLTAADFQNIYQNITFRVYGWNADNSAVEFRIKDFGFKGTISEYAIWNGTSWSNTTGPNLGIRAIIDGDYNTSVGGTQTSFRCKSLIINSGKTLTIDNETFVEVNYNISGDGNLIVETKGAFVQRNDGGFSVTGTSKVNKSTPYKDEWYYYTYWSSPVKNMDIEVAFPNIDRKYYWDDTSSSWEYATNQIMQTGLGYTITGISTGVQTASFLGEFNTGTITIPIFYNPANAENWSLIGNPYPSAIDLDQFLGTNTDIIDGVVYFWSQETPPVGGQFSGADYIPFNTTGSVSTSSDPTRAVNGFVPSGQSFFIASKASGNATFTNAMRMADITSNSQFFKSTGFPPKGFSNIYNKLWVNLSSDNGIFSQILVGYMDGATDFYDGLAFDAVKFGEGSGAFLYSTIENSNDKFVIQAKDVNSINTEESISIGLKTKIASNYSISIAKLQGDFLNRINVYLKDNLLNVIHDLSASEYTFSSEIGDFNTRFEIVFNGQALSNKAFTKNIDTLEIIEYKNDYIAFSTTISKAIKKVKVYNLVGQCVLDLKGNKPTEAYRFSNLNRSVYIAKVTLDDGTVLTKKIIKK